MSKSNTFYSLRSFMSYFARYKLRFVVTLTSFTVANIALAVIPVFIGKLVGALAARPVHGHEAVFYMWVLIVLSASHHIFWTLSEYIYTRLISPLSFSYENIMFRHIIRRPYPFFVNKFTGKLSSYISTISQELRGLFDDICYQYLSQIINLIVMFAILLSVNWQTGLIFVAGVLLMYGIGRKAIHNSTLHEAKFEDVQSTKNARIIDAIANFVNVKSFHTEAREITAIAVEQQRTAQAFKRSQLWTQYFWAWMGSSVRIVIWPATIGANVYLFLHGQLSIAQLSTVLSTILLFSTTVWDLVYNVSRFNLRFARTEEAHRYLFGAQNIIHDESDSKQPANPQIRLDSALEIRQLNFAYPDKPDAPVLRDLNLTLAKGQKLGIVGKSGSGKSTLIKLLLDYYPIERDTIIVDGIPVRTRDLSRLISYVPQDTSLFHRSLANNIAYATTSKVSHDDIVRAAKQAHAHEFIEKISNGYEAMVGERGVKLSVGQRQRVAIARAFLDDKPILILDEATSALDSESELLVQQALENLWADKTVIAIAHRLSTLRHMDTIIVMDEGKIIEQGTHQQLLDMGGRYALLWNHQSGGFIEE